MTYTAVLVVSVIVTTVCCSAAELPKNDEDVRRILSGMLKNYDPKLRPNYLGEPVEVIVDTTVLSISNIDEVSIWKGSSYIPIIHYVQ